MFHPDSATDAGLELILVQAIRQILAAPGPTRYFAWARARLPELLRRIDGDLDALERRRLASLLATAVWNAMPHPDNGFRPRPLAPPLPEAACPCGSGEPHGHCCGSIQDMPEFSTELIWELLLGELPEPGLREALALNAVPRLLRARIADRWLDAGHARRAAALLEPRFASALDRLDEEDEPAFEVLCDAYDQLGHGRKKESLLFRLRDGASPPLRAAAWRRLSRMALEAGDFDAAETAFTAALRSQPDAPGIVLLEITLLVARHREPLARERARFWRRRFARLGYHDWDEVMVFLDQAGEDPRQALLARYADAMDPVLVDLHDWIDVGRGRPPPAYGLQPLAESGAPAEDGRRAARLQAPAAARRSEAAWRTLFPPVKPYSTWLALEEDVRLWETPDWLDHLLGHPELADSLEVLDDLVNALHLHPESALPWVAQTLMRPLLDRAWSLLGTALPPDAPWCIPWSEPANRAALRLLFRRYLALGEANERDEAVQTLETLLRLNPADHHGARAELMNRYLREGHDERALALAERFPADSFAELVYGEVLARYRLGQRDQARRALAAAVRRLPRVPLYLTRKRVRRPGLAAAAEPVPGGDLQAWDYRQAMRDLWIAEPEILDWLKHPMA